MPIPRTFRRLAAAAIVTLAASSAQTGAQAQVNLLVNGSFENTTGVSFAGGSFCYLGFPGLDCEVIPGWTGETPALILSTSSAWQNPNATAGFDGAAQGAVFVGLQSEADISQTVTLAAGDYTLSWRDSHRSLIRFDMGPQAYEVRLGTQVLASFLTSPGDPWTQRSVSFSTAGGALALTFDGVSRPGPGLDATTFLDDIRLVGAVPEPGTWAMWLAGAGVLLARRRRRDG